MIDPELAVLRTFANAFAKYEAALSVADGRVPGDEREAWTKMDEAIDEQRAAFDQWRAIRGWRAERGVLVVDGGTG